MITDDICVAIFDQYAQKNLTSKAQAYISLVLYSWVDDILTAVPTVKNFMNFSNELEFNNFISWCFKNNNLLNWTIGISMIRYLNYLKKDIDKHTRQMLILFSCSQWTYEDKTGDNLLFVASDYDRQVLFCSKKRQDARESRLVYMIKNSALDIFDGSDFYYFTLCDGVDINNERLLIKRCNNAVV